MLTLDPDVLECDLAETYGIYDYRALPAYRVALFAVGLRNDSRIKQKLSDTQQPLETLLLALCLDRLSMLQWMQTTDAQKGKNKPASIYETLIGKEEKKQAEIMTFESGSDFESYRSELLNKLEKGN